MVLLPMRGINAKQNFYGSCRLKDIENIIGGDTYMVDRIVARSIVTECTPPGGTIKDRKNADDEILVAGRMTNIET